MNDEESKSLISSIHGKKFLDRKLFCNGIVPLTPEKPPIPANIEEPLGVPIPAPPAIAQGTATDPKVPPLPATEDSPSDLESNFEPCVNPELLLPFNDNDTDSVVRRYSLSLSNRTPPKGSLEADLLGTLTPGTAVSRTKFMVNEVKDLTDQLSDFYSCVSELSESDLEEAGHESELKIKLLLL